MSRKLIALSTMLVVSGLYAQNDVTGDSTQSPSKEITIKVDESHSMKITFLLQTWIRYTEANPGTTVYGDPQSDIFDIGLRRSRVSLSGNPMDKIYVYTQFGMNNFNFISERQANFFFHDAITEYELLKEKIYLGTGLTAWAGFSRFSTPSVGTILGLDAPLYAQATNGATDQFLRKLAIYAKGNIGKWMYRVALAKPMAIQRSSLNTTLSENASYSEKAPKNQYQGYLVYNFLDQEKLKTPYFKGAYLGNKKVLNIGAGFLYQQDAMHHLTTTGDTAYSNLAIFAADVFYDVPLKNGAAISIYGAYHSYSFGPGYLRNIGAMNPANGTNSFGTINGPGNGIPMIGTGNNYYVQAGYLFATDKSTKYMPYASLLLADYDRLDDYMALVDVGVNMFLNGHGAKMTLGYQNRPVFQTLADGSVKNTTRKGMMVLQYQISI